MKPASLVRLLQGTAKSSVHAGDRFPFGLLQLELSQYSWRLLFARRPRVCFPFQLMSQARMAVHAF